VFTLFVDLDNLKDAYSWANEYDPNIKHFKRKKFQ